MKSLISLLAALLVASCAAGASNGCSTEPAGSVNVFFPGRTPSRDGTWVVDRVSAVSKGFQYDFRDGSPLRWLGPEPLPVVIGKAYRFSVDYRPGSPDASSILVSEGETLIFAALTDQKISLSIPGFDLRIGDAVCGSRGRTKCHESLVNLPLTITHAGRSATIHHGQRVRLGDYEIHALTVQRVAYSSRCADAGLPAVSLTIARVQ